MILTKTQQNYLIDKVNERVNLPLLGERGEKRVFTHAIKKVLERLEEELPKEFIQLIDDVSDGFLPSEEAEMQKSMNSVIDFLNKKVNVPFMSEKKERQLFTIVVETLFDAMKKGNKLAA